MQEPEVCYYYFVAIIRKNVLFTFGWLANWNNNLYSFQNDFILNSVKDADMLCELITDQRKHLEVTFEQAISNPSKPEQGQYNSKLEDSLKALYSNAAYPLKAIDDIFDHMANDYWGILPDSLRKPAKELIKQQQQGKQFNDKR